MSERYTQVFALPQSLYAKGMPVIIENGRLLKENTTGGVIAQFKILNISKPIIALKIGIRMRGISNEDFGEIEYEYLDLKVKRDESFGTQAPIKLENDKVRAIELYIKRVVFADNSIVEFDYGELKPLPEAKGIVTVFDSEKTALYKKFFCASASVLPCKYEDIWVCACGCVNNADEEKCHSCGFETAKAFMPIDEIITTVDYNNALELSQKEDKTSLAAAIAIFEKLNGYKDSEELLKQCQEHITKIEIERERRAEESRIAAEQRRAAAEQAAKKRKKAFAIGTPIVAACIAFVIILTTVIIPGGKYKAAVALMNDKNYEEAISAFEAMDGYKDSADKILECKYNNAVALSIDGKYGEAISLFESIGDYKDTKQQLNDLFNKMAFHEIVSADNLHTVGLKSDGTVVACGHNSFGQCDVGDWKGIVAVATGIYHTVGLKSDGTVVATKYPDDINFYDGQCDVADWKDIVAISAGPSHTVGLKSDGTVVATKYTGDKKFYDGQCDVGDWTDIVAISAGSTHTVGLKSDGTVIATQYIGDEKNNYGQCDVGGWKDIVAVSAGYGYTVGLKSDGTVVACGYNDDGQCDVGDWKGIVAVSAGPSHTVGLKSDGTAVSCGLLGDGRGDVGDWTDIIAVSAGTWHTVGLKSDGTVVACGLEGDERVNVDGWKDIKVNK